MEPQFVGSISGENLVSRGDPQTSQPKSSWGGLVPIKKFEHSVPRFGLLEPTAEERKRRWIALGASPALQAAGFALMLLIGALLPHRSQNILKREMLVVNLVAPPLDEAPPPKPARLHVPKRIFHSPPRIEVPKVEAKRAEIPPLPERHMVMPQPPKVIEPTPPAPTLPAPKPKLALVVHPGVFSTGSSAKPTIKRPVAQVQTGGFGSPNGLPGQALGGSKGNVPKLGAFDLPEGPGHGNGRGGARGAPGVVASAGFGNGIAMNGVPGEGYGRGPVQSSGFGNTVAESDQRQAHLPPPTPSFQPVVILSKPNPVYPAEARRLHIEGEVLLDVVFQATGRVRVLRVVRGLGHGMDEAAMRAAEQMVFKPARREGRPVDSQARVHIFFQLAY